RGFTTLIFGAAGRARWTFPSPRSRRLTKRRTSLARADWHPREGSHDLVIYCSAARFLLRKWRDLVLAEYGREKPPASEDEDGAHGLWHSDRRRNDTGPPLYLGGSLSADE